MYSEFFSERNVNYYIFEQREEKHFKNGEEKVYYRTARVDDERESVNLVVQHLMNPEVKYLKHKSHPKNRSRHFPIIKESFQGCMSNLIIQKIHRIDET